MSTKGSIKVFDSSDALAAGIADFIVADAAAAIAEVGRYSLVLSGGSTPEALFRLLAQPLYSTVIDWASVYIFWGDERAVPLEDERNNANTAIKLWLSHIAMPEDNIYRIPSDLPAAEAASTYERSIRDFFGGGPAAFDLILLGLGADGHTASLFPQSQLLTESTALVTSGFVPSQQMERITMTIPLINDAHKVIFLVAGKAKASIVQTIVHDTSIKEQYPAQMINPHSGGLYWFIDRAAAAQLL